MKQLDVYSIDELAAMHELGTEIMSQLNEALTADFIRFIGVSDLLEGIEAELDDRIHLQAEVMNHEEI